MGAGGNPLLQSVTNDPLDELDVALRGQGLTVLSQLVVDGNGPEHTARRCQKGQEKGQRHLHTPFPGFPESEPSSPCGTHQGHDDNGNSQGKDTSNQSEPETITIGVTFVTIRRTGRVTY